MGFYRFVKYKFEKHYTRNEAQLLLPQIREWIAVLNRLGENLGRYETRLHGMTEQGLDIGGSTVNQWIRALAEMQGILAEFQRRQIFIKDLARGLVDFPAIINSREVFLCWEVDEPTVEFWHDLDSGYTGREPLP